MNQIKFSIVTACFNSQDYLEKALTSVEKQAYKNYEHLVVDGGSTDKTPEILNKWGSKISWTSEKDQGIYDALNKGFKRASGDIFTWLDSDNYYFDEKVLEKVAEVFNKDPEVDVVVTNSYLLYPDHNNEKELVESYNTPTFKDLLNKGSQFIPESIFFKKELFQKAGGLDIKFKLLADYDLWLRMLRLKPKTIKLPIISAVYTVRSEALLRQDPFLAWQESFAIGKKHGRSRSSRLKIRLRYIWERIKYPFAKSLKSSPKTHAFYRQHLRKFFKPWY